MYTIDDICYDCKNAMICNCDQKHVYGCKINSENIDRKSGTCVDKEVKGD